MEFIDGEMAKEGGLKKTPHRFVFKVHNSL
jgi:hypothetical protein